MRGVRRGVATMDVSVTPAFECLSSSPQSHTDKTPGLAITGIVAPEVPRDCGQNLLGVQSITELKLRALATENEQLRAHNRDLAARNTLLLNGFRALRSEVTEMEAKYQGSV